MGRHPADDPGEGDHGRDRGWSSHVNGTRRKKWCVRFLTVYDPRKTDRGGATSRYRSRFFFRASSFFWKGKRGVVSLCDWRFVNRRLHPTMGPVGSNRNKSRRL